MADDGLDLPTTPTAPAQAGSAAGAAPPAPATNELAAALSKALEPLQKGVQQLDTNFKALQANAAKAQQQQPTAPAAPAKKGGSEEFWANLSDDPEEAIGQIADARARGMIANTMGPGLVDVLVGLRDWRIEQVGNEVDDKFGEGYFKEHVEPVLMKRFEDQKTYTIWDQQNKGVVGAVVNGILGNKLFNEGDEMVERMGKAKTAKAAKSPANLMGPGVNISREPERISPEVAEGLQTLAKVGQRFDAKALVAARKAGNSLDGWLPQFRAERAAKGK